MEETRSSRSYKSAGHLTAIGRYVVSFKLNSRCDKLKATEICAFRRGGHRICPKQDEVNIHCTRRSAEPPRLQVLPPLSSTMNLNGNQCFLAEPKKDKVRFELRY